MGYDLRDYLRDIDKLGDLHVIEPEVSWNLEATGIAAMWQRISHGPTWFKNIKGHPGSSIVTGLWLTERRTPCKYLSVALGLPADTPQQEMMKEVIKRLRSPIKPTITDPQGAPCKQVVQIGKDVDLYSLPFAYIHDCDAGRYIDYCSQIAVDPDSGWVNWGMYRAQIHTKNKLGVAMFHGQHGPEIFYQKYEAKGKTMPIAYAIGGDPMIFATGAMTVPSGVSEVDWAGAMRREPIELVRAETSEVYVPANAEVIIEGEIIPYERADEGPFGEYIGYVHGRYPMPLMRITAITHRKNPIIPVIVEGARLSDSMHASAAIVPIEVYRFLTEEKGWPVKGVFMPPEGTYNMNLA